MYGALVSFKNIVISGPQRSGTRIAAKIVAHDTGKTYIDEVEINNHDFRLLEYYLRKGNVVVQCPALCHMLHYITVPSTLVIVVRRPIVDIINSERRINWTEEARLQELYKYGFSEGIISKIKYDFWDKYQKAMITDARDIDYHSLSKHKMFVAKREHFRWDQTQ